MERQISLGEAEGEVWVDVHAADKLRAFPTPVPKKKTARLSLKPIMKRESAYLEARHLQFVFVVARGG